MVAPLEEGEKIRPRHRRNQTEITGKVNEVPGGQRKVKNTKNSGNESLERTSRDYGSFYQFNGKSEAKSDKNTAFKKASEPADKVNR